MVDPSMFNAPRRPIYFKRPRPRPYGYGIGSPFLGGVVGGLLGSVLLGGTGYGYGYGYGYPVYNYPPYYPYGGGLFY
jgi:hypothetical protein